MKTSPFRRATLTAFVATGLCLLLAAAVGWLPDKKSSLMARSGYVHSIDRVAQMIGESLDLSWNSDNIDGGEMIHVLNGTEESLTAFTDRGVACLQELFADIRTWDGGIHKFLLDEQCDPDVIERIRAYEKKA